MKPSDTFTEWLEKQNWRDDPVGDLAIDFLATGSDVARLQELGRGYTGCYEARDALDEALREWMGRSAF